MKSRILGLILVIMLALTGCYGQGVEMGLAGVEPVIPDTRDEEVAMIIRGEETLMFTSLADAVAAVKNGETIQMIADTEEGTISYDGGTFIIDLNGKMARIAGFSLSGNMNLTLRDEKEYKGKLHLASTGPVSGIVPDTDRQVKLTVAGANIESEGLLLYSRGNGSSVTVLGGKITCAGAMQNDNTGCGAISGSGVTEVTISGGTFTVGQGQAVRLEKDKGKVTISGGYINAALEVIRAAKQAEISGGTLVGHGTVSDSAKGSEELHGTDIATVSITGGYFGHDQSGRTDWLGSFVCIEDSGDGDSHEDSAYVIKAAVARYAETNYVSLAKALEAAGSSEDSEIVVTLLANAEQTGLPYKLVSGKTLVIKLNGHSDPQLNVTPADGSPAGSEVSRTEDSGSITYRSAVAYMVLYDLNGAPEASGTQYGYPHLFEGTKTPIIPDPLWENHVFKGWNPEVVSEVNSSMADGNRTITYKAQWKDDKNGNKIADDEESFTVKYDLNGAPSEAGVTYTYTNLHLNDKTPVISDPKWNGKTFQGWKPEVAPKILAENSDVSSVITYVADWEPDIACIQRGELIFKYKSVAAALADAQSGDTIRMLMDAEENDIACKNASFILDLNGFTLKTTGFAVSGSMDITLKNSSSKMGKLQLTSSGPTSGLVPDASKKVIMTIDGAVIESEGLLLYSTGKGSAVRIISGEIVCAGAMQNEDTYCGAISGSGIEEVTISGGSLKVRKGQAIWLGKGSGTVTITGGYVSSELEVVRAAKQLDVSGGTLVGNGTDNDGTSELHGSDIQKVSLTGGYYGHDQSERDDWLGSSYICVKDDKNEDKHGDSAYVVKPAAARIGNTKYLTLSKALQAATGIEENEITIDLLIDAQETGLSYRLISGHKLIIKLNGHSDPNINVTPASGSPDGSGVEKKTADGVISYVVKIKYTVIYDLSGAPADSKIQYKYPDLFEGTKTPAIENPKWDAHVFKGWTPAVASEVKGEMADAKRNITYKANWKDDKNKNGVADDEELFTIIYKDGDSQLKKVEKQHVGDAVEQYKPEKKQYLFDKWSPDWKNKIDAAQADKDSKITYTASWKEDKNSNGKPDNEEYRTIRYTDGVLGIKVFEDKVFDKQLDGLPTPKFGDNPVRENYEFTGWLPDVPEQVNGSRTYTATWKYVGSDTEPSDEPVPEDLYTVIYQLNGGKTASEQTTFTGLKIGDKTPRIDDPERNGYEFTGWSPAIAEEVTGNATYSANWELIVTPDDNPEPPTVQVNWTIIAIVIVAAIAALLAILGLRKRKA